MSFKNMSPADRMKASGLIGLIVVIVFFVMRTVLGAVSPKKPADAAPSPGAGSTATAPAPTPGGASTAVNTPGGPMGTPAMWPASQVKRDGPSIASSVFAKDPEDPFEPLPSSKKDALGNPAGSAKKEPAVQVKAEPFSGGHDSGPLPWPGAGKPLPNGGLAFPAGPGPGGPQAVAVAIPVEPEIRLIGFVHGDTAVATVQVGNRSMIVRPGDPLAKGWRLMGIDPEGVTIRHSKDVFNMKTGGVLNEADGRPK